MKYITDRPIETNEQDLLGRSTFTNYLADSIMNYESKDGLVIGLYGKWGSGKSSISNMAISKIEQSSASDRNKPIIINFSPWNYSDKNNLISLFFNDLEAQINKKANDSLKKKLGNVLVKYKDTLDVLSLIPTIGSSLSLLLKSGAEYMESDLNKLPSLEETKSELEEALNQSSQKIIVVIDDVDRLSNSQIRDIFQLVKQVGDFPNIIYILLMDKEIVSRALTEVHNIDGNAYLEKIIQVPFEIPELDKVKIENLFINKVSAIIADAEITISTAYWDRIFQYCIKPYISTLRDINRVINIFQFKYYALKEETCVVDLLALSTIEVIEPDLYKWIRVNKNNLVYSQSSNYIFSVKEQPDFEKKYINEFIDLELNPDTSIKSVASLFQTFDNDLNKNYSIFESESELRRQKRLAHPEKFNLCFSFDLDSVKVSNAEIENIINKYDKDSLQETIKSITSSGSIKYLLDELTSMVEQIPYSRLEIITKSVIENMGYLETIDSSRSEIRSAERFVCSSFERIKTNDERFEILKTSLKNMNIKALGFFSFIINKQGHAFGRIEHGPQIPEKQIISSKQLDILERKFLDKIYNINPPEAMFNILEFPFLLGEWEIIDEEGQYKFLSALMSDEQFMLRFVCNLAHRWYGNGEGGWEFYDERYIKFVSDDQIYKTIQDWVKENLDKFDKEEQIKLATFVLRYKSENDNLISESEAIQLLDRWNKEV